MKLSFVERNGQREWDHMFSYDLNKEGTSATVYFKGDLDIEVTEMIEEQLIPLLKEYTMININMSGVHFVDSTGIGLLINLVETLKSGEKKPKITISDVQSQVLQVFEIIQLHEILGQEVFV